jgi:hypothetical protein
MYSFSVQQVSQYRQDGFLYPLPALKGSELIKASTELEGTENN